MEPNTASFLVLAALFSAIPRGMPRPSPAGDDSRKLRTAVAR